MRGLNAPARRSLTPFSTRNSAVCRIIASFSTEHGPAMIVNVSGPMLPLRQVDDRVRRVHLAAGELVRLGDADALLDAGEHFERARIDGAGVAGDADGGARRAGHRMRRQVQQLDRVDDTGNLFRGGPGLHDDEHVAVVSSW